MATRRSFFTTTGRQQQQIGGLRRRRRSNRVVGVRNNNNNINKNVFYESSTTTETSSNYEEDNERKKLNVEIKNRYKLRKKSISRRKFSNIRGARLIRQTSHSSELRHCCSRNASRPRFAWQQRRQGSPV